MKTLLTIILGLALFALPEPLLSSREAWAAALPESAEITALPLGARAEIQAIIDEKASRSPDEAKIDSHLLLGMRAIRQLNAGTPQRQPAFISEFVQQHVATDQFVKVSIDAAVSAGLLEALTALGAQDVNALAAYGAITARMPIVALSVIAARPDVRFIGLFDPGASGRYVPLPDETFAGLTRPSAIVPLVGAATSQGVVAHAADKVHGTGIIGTGVKVCVLSDGVNSLAARQASGDLPAVDVVAGQAGVGDEGTAMLEIIRDMAPGAALGFATAHGGEAQMAANIQTLRNSPHNCDIIVDDWTYFLESPFQEGVIAQAVTTVTNSGALYFSDAANSGSFAHGTSGTWEGDFVNSGIAIGTVPEAGTLHKFGANAYDTISQPSPFNWYVLSWGDPRGASANDYDLFILDSTLSTVLDSSTNSQTGTGNPQEYISNGSIGAGAKIVVVNYQGAAAPRALRVDTERGRLSLGTNGNTFGHNGGISSITTAAVSVGTAGGGVFTGGGANPVESFSSDGPRRLFYTAAGAAITPGNILFGTGGGTLLNKVDIAAADGVSTTTPGFNPFYGTSAAAPHAAAIAALIKSAGPTLGSGQIRSALQTTALDIEGAGPDVNAGSGLVMANASVRSVLTPIVVGTTFSPTSIAPGATSTLAVTLKNNNGVALQGVALTDNYPVSLVNSPSPNPQLAGSGCAGNLVAAAGGSSLTLANATVPAGVTCTASVIVTSSSANVYSNSTGAITTPIGLNSSGVMATLTVTTSGGPLAPSVTTGPASNLTASGATLNGNVSSNGASTTVTFQYGPTTGYGSTVTAAQSPLPAGAASAPVSTAITGLDCGSTYHFRVVAANSAGTTNGSDTTLATAACAGGVVTTTTLASNLNPSTLGTTVTFTATVAGAAPQGTVRFTDGGVTLSGCAAVALAGSGNTRSAACVAGALTLGAHSIIASYGGDAGNLPSVSSPLAQTVVAVLPGTGIVAVNPYGAMTVQNGTIIGSTMTNLQPNAIIQLGPIAGAAGSYAMIDFQGFNLGPSTVLTVRPGAPGQTLVLHNTTAAASSISGSLLAQAANGAAAPGLYLWNPSGIAIGTTGTVTATSGLTLDAISNLWTVGNNVVNAGSVDGGASLTLFGANIKGGGSFKGNTASIATFGSANNPVNGAHYLANGLQFLPSAGSDVYLTVNAFGAAPQYLNLMVNGNAHLWMPSAWPSWLNQPPNNQTVPPGGSRAAGVPDPTYGASSSIFQATGSLTLTREPSAPVNDFVFPGGIVLKAGGTLDLNGVLVNQGWTTTGQAFQGTFFQSPNIVSSAGNIQVLSNNLNWVNFSTLPHAPVRAWTLARAADGSAQYFAADGSAPHLNTYSILIEAAAAGQCWVCLVNNFPVNMY